MATSFFGFLLVMVAVWFFRAIIKRSVNQTEKVLMTGINQSDVLLAEQNAKILEKSQTLPMWVEPEDVQAAISLKRAESRKALKLTALPPKQ